MKSFDKPFNANGQEIFTSASVGVSIYPFDGKDAETLIKNADIAMYKAKSKGKNQYVMCTSIMKEEARKNLVLTNNLYRALEKNELSLHYQPQLRLRTSEIIGLEALLRWNHPVMGMIPPNVFIPLAEQSGLINGIGEWVLETACRQNKRWQDLGFPRLRMAVNLSVIQFNNPEIVKTVDKILKRTNLDPKYLELEITESIAIREAKYTTAVLNELKNLGITISIDDFGTKYSSLTRLKMLPVDRLKIDMQFIQGIQSSEKDQAITESIIKLAKSLKLSVLAEGVETKTQLEFLNKGMCDEVQGFYYFKPMPSEEIEKILLPK
ncbi:MAG TPA: GGDEF domain-containing phosphodiesterase [Clostridia bacterium]|nr:GGDEF domain-containing phosphodiesterase [Clostridia bacterium]